MTRKVKVKTDNPGAFLKKSINPPLLFGQKTNNFLMSQKKHVKKKNMEEKNNFIFLKVTT